MDRASHTGPALISWSISDEARSRGVSARHLCDLIARYRPPLLHSGRRRLFDAVASAALTEAIKGTLDWQIDRIVENATPAHVAAVYFLLKQGQVIYVGQSRDVFRRIGQHSFVLEFDRFFFIECDPADLDRIETHYIRRFQPSGNTFGVDRA